MTGSVFNGVHDFFHAGGSWEAVRLGLVGLVLLFWLATIYWVNKDARRRIESPALVALATLIGAIPPFLGPLIYMLFRPPEYLEDIRERDLEIQAIESRLRGSESKCKVCGCTLEADFLVCPVCTTKLRSACSECSRPLEPAWQVCPYCATPVPAEDRIALAPAPPRRTRSRGTPAR